FLFNFFFSSRRRHTRFSRDWSSDVCSSDLTADLPPLGWRTYRIVPVEAAPASETSLSATDHTLENRFFRLEIDPQTGQIASLFDKRHGVEVFAGPAARAVVIDDPSDTWSHNVFRFQDEIGQFTATSVRLVESGPVLATVRVKSAFGA